MDIAQYIGIFLLKNEYCYLPGIGSLSVERKPAVYNPETKEMEPPVYEVAFQKTISAIDDAFANFIANNERISIAHASNHFKDYCARMKLQLKEGKEMIIPGIGHLKMDDQQEIYFVQDPHLEVKGKSIPFFRNSPSVTEKKKEDALTNIISRTEIKEPRADEEIIIKPPQVNWVKIIIWIIVLLGIIAVVIYFLRFNNTPAKTTQEPGLDSAQIYQQPLVSSAAGTDAADGITTNPDGTISYKVILHDYTTRDRAERRVSQLQSYGNKVYLMSDDAGRFYVVMDMISAPADTTRVIDSLMVLFNPNGDVRIRH